MTVTLDLRLDKSEMRASSPMTGAVLVSTTDDCRCDGLDLVVECRIFGKVPEGTPGRVPDKVVVARTERLFEGEWKTGEHKIPFDLAAPAWPLSWAGQRVEVQWRLRAHANLAWASDVESEASITVTAPRPEDAPLVVVPTNLGDPARVGEVEEVQPESHWTHIAAGSVFLTGFTAGAIALFVNGSWIGGGALALCALFAGLFVAIKVVYQITEKTHTAAREAANAVRHRYGQPQVALAHRPDEGSLECALWVKPDAPAIEPVATIRVRERTSSTVNVGDTSTTKTTWHGEDIWRREVTLTPDESQVGRYNGEIPLPRLGEVPGPFLAHACKVSWHVAVDVGVGGIDDTGHPLRVRTKGLEEIYEDIVG